MIVRVKTFDSEEVLVDFINGYMKREDIINITYKQDTKKWVLIYMF